MNTGRTASDSSSPSAEQHFPPAGRVTQFADQIRQVHQRSPGRTLGSVNEEAIKVLVREYGMSREGKATRWRQIDLAWLRDQRAAGRTCRELAEETGFSLGMISYLGRQHDLPGRTRCTP